MEDNLTSADPLSYTTNESQVDQLRQSDCLLTRLLTRFGIAETTLGSVLATKILNLFIVVQGAS